MSQNIIFEQNGTLSVAPPATTRNHFPQGVYLLEHGMHGFFLSRKENFELPKLYGNHDITKRWNKSFREHGGNLGILLSGLKGTGKTLEAKKFCIESGLPVILVNVPYKGTSFIDFLTETVLGEFILFIDEFEKIYNEEDQQTLLSLMDGAYKTRIVFLLTVNKTRINENLINRLGRIKYRKHYEELEEELIWEVIDDMLINKENADSIFDFIDKAGIMTYDILVKLIQEMNMFDEDALLCGKHLNITSTSTSYEIYEEWDGKLQYLSIKSMEGLSNKDKDGLGLERVGRNMYWVHPKRLMETVYGPEEIDVDEDTPEDIKATPSISNYLYFDWKDAEIHKNKDRSYVVKFRNQYGARELVTLHFKPVKYKSIF